MKNDKDIDYYSNPRNDVIDYIPKSITTILDIGCSLGCFLNNVKKSIGAETWGVDCCNQSKIIENSIDYYFNDSIENVISKLPDNYFDCITFNDVLEHLQYPEEVLHEIKVKLTDNGVIIASIPNIYNFSILKMLILKKEWEYKGFGIMDYTHLRFFTKKSIVRLFEDTGYKIASIKGINYKLSLKRIIMILLSFGFLIDSIFPQYVCIVRKK